MADLDAILERRGIANAAKDMGWKPKKLTLDKRPEQWGWMYPVYDLYGKPFRVNGNINVRWKNGESGGDPKYFWLGKPDHATYYVPAAPNFVFAEELQRTGLLWWVSGEPDVLTMLESGTFNVWTVFGESHIPDDVIQTLTDLGVSEVRYPVDVDQKGLRTAWRLHELFKDTDIEFKALRLPGEFGSKHDLNWAWQQPEYRDNWYTFLPDLPLWDESDLFLYGTTLEEKNNDGKAKTALPASGEAYVAPDLLRDLQLHFGLDSRDFNSAGWSRKKVTCPFHDDHSPSATFHVDGVLYCHSSCGMGYGAHKTAERLGFDVSRYYQRESSRSFEDVKTGVGTIKKNPKKKLQQQKAGSVKPAHSSSKNRMPDEHAMVQAETNGAPVDQHRTAAYDLYAETALIAASLNDGSVIDDVSDLIQSEFFFSSGFRAIWETWEWLKFNQKAYDIRLLRGRLAELNVPISDEYFDEILWAVHRRENVRDYASRIRECYQRRVMHTETQGLLEALNNPQLSLSDLILHSQRITDSAMDMQTAKKTEYSGLELLDRQDQRMTEAMNNPDVIRGITTGMKPSDAVLYMIQPTDLIVVAGRPGMAKSSWLFQVFYYLAKHYHGGYIASLEMTEDKAMARIRSQQAVLNVQRMVNFQLSNEAESRINGITEWERYAKSREYMEEPMTRLRINDSRNLTVKQLQANARRMLNEQGCSAVGVDYLQIMQSGVTSLDDPDKDFQRISYNIMQMKELANTLKIPVFALAQLNRKVDSRASKEPLLNDLRQTGQIEQEADLVIFLVRKEVYFPDKPEHRGKALFLVAKHRNGPQARVQMGFYKSSTGFYDTADPEYRYLMRHGENDVEDVRTDQSDE